MNHNKYVRQVVTTTAQAILDGTIGIIEGSITMYRISHEAVAVWHEDEDFRVFGLIASDTDHLPTGSARQYWNPAALAREDRKIEELEDRARSEVRVVCKNLLVRFNLPDRGSGRQLGTTTFPPPRVLTFTRSTHSSGPFGLRRHPRPSASTPRLPVARRPGGGVKGRRAGS